MKEGKPLFLNAKIKSLNSIGLRWQVKKYSPVPWIEQFEELNKIKLDNDHCKVTQKYKDIPSLGVWVKNQRNIYTYIKEGKTSFPSENKLEAFNVIGFT